MKKINFFVLTLAALFTFSLALTACEQEAESPVAAVTNPAGTPTEPTPDEPTPPAATPEEAWVIASAYREQYAATLELTVEAVRMTDENAVYAARTAYKALIRYAQSLLIAEKALLDSLLVQIAAIEAAPYTVHSLDGIQDYLATYDGTPYGTIESPIRLILGPECDHFEIYGPGVEGFVAGNPGNGGSIKFEPLFEKITRYVDLDLSACPTVGRNNGTFTQTSHANKQYIVVARLPASVTGMSISNKSEGGGFAYYANLKKVYFPGPVNLSKVAFAGCSKLEEIYAPKATGIGEDFAISLKLKSLTLGKTPPILDSMAFQKLISLHGLDIHVPYGTSVNDPTKGYGKWYEDNRSRIPFLITFVVDAEED
jgi:hypothetical protein